MYFTSQFFSRSIKTFLFLSCSTLVTMLPGQNAPIDSDLDGWFDEAQNRRFELFVQQVEKGKSKQRKFKIAVENRIFKSEEMSHPVTWRSIGAWVSKDSVPVFESNITCMRNRNKLYRSESFTLKWTGKDTVFELQHGKYRLKCAVLTIFFADPSPDYDGDCDEDGIRDSEETLLAQQGRRIGNPLQKDILLVGAWTHRHWRMTRETVIKMTTAFGKQGVNLLFVTEADELPGVLPGLTRHYGLGKRKKWWIDREYVRRFSMISDHIPEEWQRFAHITVFARRASCMGSKVYGCSELPGLVTVVRARIRFLPANTFNYQAGTLMHEFGHNLGLCHPKQKTPCPTGPLPKEEQDAGATAMGSPIDDGGLMNPKAWINAFRRPMDYTPTQWNNLAVALAVSKKKRGCRPAPSE